MAKLVRGFKRRIQIIRKVSLSRTLTVLSGGGKAGRQWYAGEYCRKKSRKLISNQRMSSRLCVWRSDRALTIFEKLFEEAFHRTAESFIESLYTGKQRAIVPAA